MSSAPESNSILDDVLTREPTKTASSVAHNLNLVRADDGLTRVRQATRSTMLWALLATDDDIARTFRDAGVSLEAWTRKLGLSTDPARLLRRLRKMAEGGDEPSFHPDLLEAVERHLPRHRSDDTGPPSAAQLALALLDSMDTGTSDKLPTRLTELRFDRSAAHDQLHSLATTRSIHLDDFSASVRHVIGNIGLANNVTPSRLAAELADLHPDYAGGRLGTVDFDGDETTPYPLTDLLATVRHLAGELETDQVINTRDVLVHLASFDDHVRAALDSNGAYEQLLNELGRSPAAPADQTRPSADRPTLDMLADIPIDDPEFDVMNFGPYVEAVVALIENPRTTTPLSIAVNGPWGSGKTSLGRMVETRLRKDREDRLAPIVTWFNAWLHDSADDLGAALTAHVGRTLNPHRRPLRRLLQLLPKNMLNARQRYLRKLWVAALGFMIAITVAYGWVRMTTDGIFDGSDETPAASANDDSVAGAAAGGGASAALVLAIVAAASRLVDPARSAAAFIASPRSEAQDGALNEARKEIGSLLEQAGVPTVRDMVIFVDDLERSRPPSAIDICEVANQLLDHPGVFIIYLADMAKIASAVEIKYKDYAEWASLAHQVTDRERRADNGDEHTNGSGHGLPAMKNGNGWWGRSYMEKMVQIQIDIPELDRTASSDLLRLITAHSRAAADRRQENRQRHPYPWMVTLVTPLAVAGRWFEDRRKRTLAERLNRLINSNREGGTLDVDAFETEAAKVGIDADMIGRVIQRNTQESETYRAAEAIAVDYLPSNPRAIKRLANRLRFEAEVSDELGLVFGPETWVDPSLVGKWAVLTTRWPSLVESLRSGRLDCTELETLTESELADRLEPHVRPGVADHEIDHLTHLLTTEPRFGETIDRFLYHRLAPTAEPVG